MNKRLVVTGMSILTPIGDNCSDFLKNLLTGKSAITHWKHFDTTNIYSKIGGDLSDYDIESRVNSFKGKIPDDLFQRLHHLINGAPWGIQMTLLSAVAAYIDANLSSHFFDNRRVCITVAGHNLNQNFVYNNHIQFSEEPDFINGLFALRALDTDHAASISEVLQFQGPTYTLGGACASGNIALRAAIDEIRYHDMEMAFVTGPLLEFSPLDLEGMAILDAISYKNFNDYPEKASRPYDLRREGFVPSHGNAVLVVEELEHAKQRNAKIYAEIIGVESNADACHLPQPSITGQANLIRTLLDKYHINPNQIDYISAHATSTLLGDATELYAIKDAFGQHAFKLKINAPKSMLGHTCWAAAIVETVAAILQMNAGILHPSINIDNLDPEVDLDVCANHSCKHQINLMLKNSFGFGGINSISLIKRYSA